MFVGIKDFPQKVLEFASRCVVVDHYQNKKYAQIYQYASNLHLLSHGTQYTVLSALVPTKIKFNHRIYYGRGCRFVSVPIGQPFHNYQIV
jgi:hypothetical protein